MAVSIASLLLLGLTGHLRGGLLAWRRTTTALDELARTRALLDQCARDLTHAVVLDPRSTARPAMRWAADRLQLYTVVSTRDATGAHQEVQWVTYAVADQPDGPQLVRTAQSVQAARAGVTAPDVSWSTTATALALRYGYLADDREPRIVWRAGWKDAAQLPRLVEVTTDWPSSRPVPRRIRQVIVIPTGVLTSVAEAG